MIDQDKLKVQVFISGRVQGVNFRHYTQKEASSLGLTGWVRNLPDSRVEAVFEGNSEAIHRMVAWCYSGPTLADIENVEVDYFAPTGEFSSFEIKW